MVLRDVPAFFFGLTPWVVLLRLLFLNWGSGSVGWGSRYLVVLRLVDCVGSVLSFSVLVDSGSLASCELRLLLWKPSSGVAAQSSIFVESWSCVWVYRLLMLWIPRIILLRRSSSIVNWCLRLLRKDRLLMYRFRHSQLQLLLLPILRLLKLCILPFSPPNWRIELALLWRRILKSIHHSIISLLRHHNNTFLPRHLLRIRIKIILLKLKGRFARLILWPIIWCLKWLTFWSRIVRKWSWSTFVSFVDEHLLIVVLGHIVYAEVWWWEYLSYVELVVSIWSSSIESCIWMSLSTVIWFLSLDSHYCLLQGHTKNMLFCDAHWAISLPALLDNRHLLPFCPFLGLNARRPCITNLYAVIQIQVVRIMEVLFLEWNLHALIHLVSIVSAASCLLYFQLLRLWFWWWRCWHRRLQSRIVLLRLDFSLDS